MSRRLTFVSYKPKTILNKHKRADHWFWTRYSAYPYLGCQHGCEFCYCREQKYSPYDDPNDFSFMIKVKENAAQLLRRALSRTEVDLIFTGDYQPAEKKFGLSRQMLEVCRDMGFPVFILERSPLVLRDLSLIKEINANAPSVVAFSIIATPNSPNHKRVRQMEHLAPAVEKRFAAMQAFAEAGILTGACFMPILPGLCDNDANLESVIRWTAEHGGKFVLPGSLTLSDQQKKYFFKVLAEGFPELVYLYQKLYPPSSYAPVSYNWPRIAVRIRELCEKYGISDRIPRPIIPSDKRALNKLIVEQLANKVYEMEIHQEAEQRIWAYRKAAWAIEDLPQDIGLVYQSMGLKGLQSIANVGEILGETVEKLILQYQTLPGQVTSR
ncbi:MAG TPA: radical SAM protein [Anaerolineales bacterium]|nr:radical SAM protein [Anaerolineales bacterium]